ncbi:MAG: hypothetical protein KGO81_08875 [Bacteroidota bacterium]|nr:hypothetical protein [Bacteroidota bacterium]
MKSPFIKNQFFLAVVVCLMVVTVQPVKAQWLLNFGTATTVKPKDFVFISGTGAQFTFMHNPSASTSFTPFLAHAGLRLGLTPNLDAGYRLCTVALPFSSVGPTLGSAVDVKLRVTPLTAAWQVGLIAGGGLAYVQVANTSKSAWSPGAAVCFSRNISSSTVLTINGRFVNTAIPSAPGGGNANFVTSAGTSVGLASNLNSVVAIMPEIGIFDLHGKINDVMYDGIGVQLGVVLKVDFAKTKNK